MSCQPNQPLSTRVTRYILVKTVSMTVKQLCIDMTGSCLCFCLVSLAEKIEKIARTLHKLCGMVKAKSGAASNAANPSAAVKPKVPPEDDDFILSNFQTKINP